MQREGRVQANKKPCTSVAKLPYRGLKHSNGSFKMFNQKYGASSASATPTEQAVKNPPLAAQTKAQSELAYLQKRLQEETNQLVIEADAFNARNDGLYTVIRALTTTLSHYVTSEYRDQARTTDNDDIDYFNKVITGSCDAIEFIVRLSELRNSVGYFQKEVSRG